MSPLYVHAFALVSDTPRTESGVQADSLPSMSRLVVALRGLSLPRCQKCATKRSCLFVPQLSYSEEIAVEEVTFCDAQGRALWVVAPLKPGGMSLLRA